ncbi:hypothetical protein [Paractinoplanes toevensis]|uniref:Uncharacterized protein n=1 Tax=Paractinoplanes toevensis TaxID=571911 RepID=A0A919W7C1_9ACTN|nr:hypothetical protein [Actinoplanes toevensis]GIM88791.1 hypothetical protein Ato02nite_005840 [Actinoplanes toevensis]
MEYLPSEPAPKLPWGPKLTAREDRLHTRLVGLADRFVVDSEADESVLPALLALSDDPRLWGLLLGRALRRVELGESSYMRLVEAAREAGADEEVAQVHLAWLRATPGV